MTTPPFLSNSSTPSLQSSVASQNDSFFQTQSTQTMSTASATGTEAGNSFADVLSQPATSTGEGFSPQPNPISTLASVSAGPETSTSSAVSVMSSSVSDTSSPSAASASTGLGSILSSILPSSELLPTGILTDSSTSITPTATSVDNTPAAESTAIPAGTLPTSSNSVITVNSAPNSTPSSSIPPVADIMSSPFSSSTSLSKTPTITPSTMKQGTTITAAMSSASTVTIWTTDPSSSPSPVSSNPPAFGSGPIPQNKVLLIVALTTGIALVCLSTAALLFFCCWVRRKRRRQDPTEGEQNGLQETTSSREVSISDFPIPPHRPNRPQSLDVQQAMHAASVPPPQEYMAGDPDPKHNQQTFQNGDDSTPTPLAGLPRSNALQMHDPVLARAELARKASGVTPRMRRTVEPPDRLSLVADDASDVDDAGYEAPASYDRGSWQPILENLRQKAIMKQQYPEAPTLGRLRPISEASWEAAIMADYETPQRQNYNSKPARESTWYTERIDSGSNVSRWLAANERGDMITAEASQPSGGSLARRQPDGGLFQSTTETPGDLAMRRYSPASAYSLFSEIPSYDSVLDKVSDTSEDTRRGPPTPRLQQFQNEFSATEAYSKLRSPGYYPSGILSDYAPQGYTDGRERFRASSEVLPF